MKKRVSVILVLFTLLNLWMPVYASGNIVDNVLVSENGLVVSGTTGSSMDEVTIALLKADAKVSDLKDISTKEDFLSKVAYITIVTTGLNGSYEKAIKVKSTEGTTLYVTNQKQTYIAAINKGTVVEETGKYVNFIDYSDDRILFKGMTDYANTELRILVLKEGNTLADYVKDNSVLLISANVTSGDDARYELYIDNVLEKGKKYNTYIVKNGSNLTANKNNSYIIEIPTEIYVSNKRNGPDVFPSIKAARDYLKTNLKDVPVDVIIDEGEFTSISFEAEDKRTTDKRVKYKAADGEKVVLTGGKKIRSDNIVTVTDENILNMVYDHVKGKLVQINLNEAGMEGIANFAEEVEQYKMPVVPYVFLNGKLQKLAQWPNEDYETIGTVKNIGETALGNTTGRAKFVFDNADKLNKWKNAENMYLKGYFVYAWSGEWAKVDTVDSQEKTITLKNPTYYGIEKGQRFAAVNLLEEIDIPGEWYISKENIMYYLPPCELSNEDVLEIATLEDDIVRFNNTGSIILDGLIIEKTYNSKPLNAENSTTATSNGVEIKKSEEIGVFGCTIRNVSANGVVSSESRNVWVDRCRIYNTGLSGINFTGQDKITLKSNNNIASDCNISDVSLNYMYNSATGIKLNSTGNLAENNTIHNVVTNGIYYNGSENIIRNNEIYLASTETADSGAIYTGRRWDSVGNIIEKNYIHQIGPEKDLGKEIWYIYFDDAHAGNIARSNILVGNNKENTRGVHIAQGPNNVINSNTFVNFGTASLIDFSYRGPFHELVFTSLETIPYNEAPYSTKYPYLSQLGALYDAETKEFDYKSYKENIDASYNISSNSGTMINDKGVTWLPNGGTRYWWYKNGGRKSGTKMYKTTIDNRENVGEVFVNASDGDYRVKNSYNAPQGVLTESNFNINSIGSKNAAEDKEFKLLYPANGELYADTTLTFAWEKSYDADNYIYTIAKDKDFDNVVKSGSTTSTFVQVSGLSADTTYYWKVEAETKARVKKSWQAEKIYVFSTYTSQQDFDITYGNLEAKYNTGEKVTELISGEKITVTDEITSKIPASDKLVYIFAVYSQNGELLHTSIKHMTVVSDENPVVIMEFIMPDIKEAYNYKIFRWECFSTLKPIK